MQQLLKLTFAMLTLTLAPGCDNGQGSSPKSSRQVAALGPAVALTGRVTDAAHVLTPEQEAALSNTLEALERKTSHQMVVVTVPNLGGQDVAVFTRNLANNWGIGRKGYDDGVVLLVAPNEHKARIAVGYGVEKKLPDELCQRIMAEQIIPRFRQGDLPGGIEAGVIALTARLT
jgi:uncharacterized protein